LEQKHTRVKVCPDCGAPLAVETTTVTRRGVDVKTGRVSKKTISSCEEGPFVYCTATLQTIDGLTVEDGYIIKEE
jgi:hypothetical protein